MKIFSNISRFLLGLIFAVFGLNGFLHFIPMPPPTGILRPVFFMENLLAPYSLQGDTLAWALQYEDAPRPKPQADEVLIRVHAAGVNPTCFDPRR